MLLDEFAFGADDFWVNESGESLLIFVVEIVADDDNALVNANLRGCHGSGKFIGMLIFPIQRKRNHIGDDLMSLVGDGADASRFLTEARVWSGDNIVHIDIIT